MRDKQLNSVAELEKVIAEMEAITELEKKQRNSSGGSLENGKTRLESDSSSFGIPSKTGDIWVKRLANGDDQIWLKRDPVGSNKVKFKEPKLRSASLSFPIKESPAKLHLKNNSQKLVASDKHKSMPQAHDQNCSPRMNPCGTSLHACEFYGTNSSLSETHRRSYIDATESSRSHSSSSFTDNPAHQTRLSSEHFQLVSSEFLNFVHINNGNYGCKKHFKICVSYCAVLF